MSTFLLGIDLGTSSVKVLITSPSGQPIGRGQAGYSTVHTSSGSAEQDPDSWWEATITAVHQAISHGTDVNKGIPIGEHVAAIGLTGQMHGTVLLGPGGRTLGRAITWQDRRSSRQVLDITERVGAERIIDITGSPAAAGFQAPTLRWLSEEKPGLWKQVERILLPKDYLRWRLTGEYITDPSDASGTLLFNIRKLRWSRTMMDVAGIDSGKLPEIYPSDTISGQLSPGVAAVLGLRQGIPVATGAGDVACGLLGAGVTSGEHLLVTISTGGQIVLPAKHPVVDLQGRIHTFCSALTGDKNAAGYFMLGAILSAGNSLRWLRDQVFGLEPAGSYQQLAEWAGNAPAGSGGIIFLPYLTGERTPHMDAEARGALLGLSIEHGREEISRAVMEGVAYACRDAFSVLYELGARPETIIMAGGGAQSHLWRQIIADVFDLPVSALVVREQAASGAAILGGQAAGILDRDEAVFSWPKYERRVDPISANRRIYKDMFEIYRETYKQYQTARR